MVELNRLCPKTGQQSIKLQDIYSTKNHVSSFKNELCKDYGVMEKKHMMQN